MHQFTKELMVSEDASLVGINFFFEAFFTNNTDKIDCKILKYFLYSLKKKFYIFVKPSYTYSLSYFFFYSNHIHVS